MLGVILINVDGYPFLAFTDMILSKQELIFSGCTAPPDSKMTELEIN